MRLEPPKPSPFLAVISNIRRGDNVVGVEICTSENDFEYIQCEGQFDSSLKVGDVVKVDLNCSRIERYNGPLSVTYNCPVKKSIPTISYSGYVLDCYDKNFDIYNIDNSVVLFTSFCHPTLQIGNKYTFNDLHVLPLSGHRDWIQSIIGPFPQSVEAILVYCPVYSSIDGKSSRHLQSQTDFSSLLFTYVYLKRKDIPAADFKYLEAFSRLLFDSGRNCSFLGHCASCQYTSQVSDLSSVIREKTFTSLREVKDTMKNMKSKLNSEAVSDNLAKSTIRVLNNELLRVKIKRLSNNTYELSDAECSLTMFVHESMRFPDFNHEVILANVYIIVEMIPRLQYSNAWSTKAYLWFSESSRICSREREFVPEPRINYAEVVSCTLVRKFVKSQSDGYNIVETQNVELKPDGHSDSITLVLDPTDKHYAFVNGEIENNSFYSTRFLVKKDCLRPSNLLKSSEYCTILAPAIEAPADGSSLLVNFDDCHILPAVPGLQKFSVKVRIYSISDSVCVLKCGKCGSKIEGGECLRHRQDFVPVFALNLALLVKDELGNKQTVLIDSFPQLCKIMNWKSSVFKKELVNHLKYAGEIRIVAQDFSFFEEPNGFFLRAIYNSPYRSQLLKLTFPISVLGNVLRPCEVEVCDSKLEILNLLSIFNSI